MGLFKVPRCPPGLAISTISAFRPAIPAITRVLSERWLCQRVRPPLLGGGVQTTSFPFGPREGGPGLPGNPPKCFRRKAEKKRKLPYVVTYCSKKAQEKAFFFLRFTLEVFFAQGGSFPPPLRTLPPPPRSFNPGHPPQDVCGALPPCRLLSRRRPRASGGFDVPFHWPVPLRRAGSPGPGSGLLES